MTVKDPDEPFIPFVQKQLKQQLLILEEVNRSIVKLLIAVENVREAVDRLRTEGL